MQFVMLQLEVKCSYAIWCIYTPVNTMVCLFVDGVYKLSETVNAEYVYSRV